MRKLIKLFYTASVMLFATVLLVVAAFASDFDVARSYFTSSGQGEAFFSGKAASSAVTKGEAAAFLAEFAERSASLNVLKVKNSDKSFSDAGSYSAAIATVYKYGVMSPSEAGKFGTDESMAYSELLSAWLTILGYSSQSGDFLAEFPYDCAGEAGIISDAAEGDLSFGQMLDVSIRAIGASFKGKTSSLVSSAAYSEAMVAMSAPAENISFRSSLSSDRFTDLGNICGSKAEEDFRFDISVRRGLDRAVLGTYKLTKITATGFDTASKISSGKRFAAFSFTGALTVDIALKNDVFSYEIYSTSSEHSHAFSDGVLSVSIAKPQTLRVVFNDNAEQEIYIFASLTVAAPTASTVENASVTGNFSRADVEFFFDSEIYINEYRVDLKNGAYFSTGFGALVSAEDLCSYFGLDSKMFDFGEEYYFGGVPYVKADSVNCALGFEKCIVDYDNRSLKYVYPDYSFDFDSLELQSAADGNLSLSNASGDYSLSQIKPSFGGLIANVTEQYGLSGGCLCVDFDAFASKSTKLMATLVARGAGSIYSSETVSLSGSTRRFSHEFTLDTENNTEHTEIYLIISPADTTYPVGLSYTVAGHTLTREEFYEQTQLVIYPEYPEQVNRIYDYKVTVTQGGRTEQIPVYNHTMWYVLGNRTVGGDSYRRFSAFAFSGEQVRVDIKVSRDVECYSVMPSALGLKSSFRDGVISVYLDKPEYFLIRLNNRDTTILSVFADYPEFHGDIPSKEDENVIWIDGWYEPSEDENIVKNGVAIPSTLSIEEPNTVLYIAPGAVLNARTNIASSATGTKVIGRGAIVDPYGNIYKTDITQGGNEGSGYRPLSINAAGTYVDGITVLDARSFNITVSTGSNGGAVEIRNVKELSSMMTTDGISLYGGIGHRVEHCFLYVGDNAFVYSSKGAYIKDCIIGTTCAAFFPQGSTYAYVFENCHVFAAYGGLINNRYNGSDSTPVEDRKNQSHTNTFINLDATDCVYLSWFFQGRNMGDLPKEFVFEGVSLPECTGTDNIHTTSGNYEIKLENSSTQLYTENYTLKMNNLYVGGKAISSREELDVQVTRSGSQKVASNTLIFTNDGSYKPVSQHNIKVGYTKSDKVFIGKMLAVFEGETVRIGGEIAMPADEILSLLRTQKKPATVQQNGKTYIKASALISSGAVKAAKETDGCLYITPAYSGEDLLLPDVGEISRYTETTCYQVELLTQKDTDGDWIYVMQKNPNAPGVSAGIARFVTDEIKMYGAGTYTLKFRVKASTAGKINIAMSYDGVNTQYTSFKVHTKDVTTSWRDISVTFDITEDIANNCEMICFRFYGSGTVLDQVFYTDISFKKN